MEKFISTIEELLELLNQNIDTNSNCNHSKYFGWENKDELQTDYFRKIAEIKNPINWSTQTNYWGSNAPVELQKYPYWICEIHKCEKCGKLFFYYPEDSGHSRQFRYRLIRPEILIDTKNNKYINLAIPRGINEFFKIVQEEISPLNKYEETWGGLWEALISSNSLPLTLTLYNHKIFHMNYGEQEATNLINISTRFNRLKRKEKIKIKAGNIV